jgi:very-short-patch-repair endonuclease
MIWILVASILVILIAVAVAVAVAAKKRASTKSGGRDYPYHKKEMLLSPAERSFLGVLEQALGSNYRIFAQVRLADLIAVRSGTAKSIRAKSQNRINMKHTDFVLCNKETLEIICAVELDDASHQKESRKVRDVFLEEACRAADLPLARFPAKNSYAIQEVKDSIFALLGASQKSVPQTEQIEEPKQTSNVVKNVTVTSAAPSCPKCGEGMDLRKVRGGAHAGKKLWGCKNYPACRGYIPLNA